MFSTSSSANHFSPFHSMRSALLSSFDEFDRQFGFASFNDDFFDRHLGLHEQQQQHGKGGKHNKHHRKLLHHDHQQQPTANQSHDGSTHQQQLTTQPQPDNSASSTSLQQQQPDQQQQQLSTVPSRSGPLDFWNSWNNSLSVLNDKLSSLGSIKVDLIENPTNYLVSAEVAGFNKDDIKLDINEGLLTISAAHSNDKQDEDKARNYVYRERSMSSVSRSIRLPKDIKPEEISAKFDNGVLAITLPRNEKKEQQQTIKID